MTSRLHRQKTAPSGHRSGNSRLRTAAGGVFGLALLLAAASLVAANTLSASGGESSSLNAQIRQLEVENKALSARLSTLTSASRIYSEAITLGFVSPQKLEKVKTSKPVALRD